MGETLYQIKDYAKVFAYSDALRPDREVTWTRFPVAEATIAYRRLMATAKGRKAFCVFVGVLRLVTRGRTNGVLTVKGAAMTPLDVSLETGIPPKDCADGFKVLQSPEIGWIVPAGGNPAAETPQIGGDSAVQSPQDRGPTTAPRAREQQRQISAAVAADGLSPREVMPLLLEIRVEGVPVYTPQEAAAIAQSGKVSPMQIAWAIERMNDRHKRGKDPIENIGGYLRSMLTEHTPPKSWREAYQRRQLAALAAQSKQPQGAPT